MDKSDKALLMQLLRQQEAQIEAERVRNGGLSDYLAGHIGGEISAHSRLLNTHEGYELADRLREEILALMRARKAA